uniref:Coiled-coil domain containing 183 n=1 Tax=Anolis carolinensis TaxID=28377 RepID=H9G3I8_ANOCA|nr:PREDICTED: coiled-coil domain-containing protein 183 isoform X2 [Anolis carolinensis]|eukprot:XP_008122544.1 PREDICTED: coiled-coil domain-containing protein 183 isoform X2 [Anolis carolinensis]
MNFLPQKTWTGMPELHQVMKHDREILSSHVFDQRNAENLLLYEVAQRERYLEALQLRLQHLLDLETPDPRAQVQMQLIRGLENNIEKMRVKIMTAEKTYSLYLKMVIVLREEVSYLPLILDDLEHRVADYPEKLRGMCISNSDEVEAMERAKEDMAAARSARAAGRKFREALLSLQKKQLERIHTKEAGDRHRRLARRDINMDFSMAGREPTKGQKLEASKAQVEFQGLVLSEVEKIKSAVKCSLLWDIAGRFKAQKKSEENLQQQIEESEKQSRGLEEQLKALELEQAGLKFHQNPQLLSSKKLENDLKRSLAEEEERLEQVRNLASKNQELLLHFGNGIDNLFVRLCGIHVPDQADFQEETGDILDKLQFCETKLLYLVETLAKRSAYDFSQEESNETFVEVRDFLENSIREERRNLRISYEEDEDDYREPFNMDHSFVPSREDIKKQGLKLIEDKTKVPKKKQRGVSKK